MYLIIIISTLAVAILGILEVMRQDRLESELMAEIRFYEEVVEPSYCSCCGELDPDGSHKYRDSSGEHTGYNCYW